jgi:hypothetical protein
MNTSQDEVAELVTVTDVQFEENLYMFILATADK